MQLMETTDNDHVKSSEMHEHICHQPKKASNSGNMGDATKQVIIVIKSSKLVVRRFNILGGIMASMSCVQIVGMNNSHVIAQA